VCVIPDGDVQKYSGEQYNNDSADSGAGEEF
jgi:hypothetical protein